MGGLLNATLGNLTELIIHSLGLVFSLKTHREFFGGDDPHPDAGESMLPAPVALGTAACLTVKGSERLETICRSREQIWIDDVSSS
ncbi:hypothetical protein BQ8482_280098 [Mesorhizobium delmotii]|uniref:Uncharacterized protein n=1 Tax=Mesorhizobium delmotii TaxID=1631247 RepID=A0A2P9AMK0_9HYPH|nr:hypothetical protein BQ8482_280098 [Mesorhizobium delmotii]